MKDTPPLAYQCPRCRKEDVAHIVVHSDVITIEDAVFDTIDGAFAMRGLEGAKVLKPAKYGNAEYVMKCPSCCQMSLFIVDSKFWNNLSIRGEARQKLFEESLIETFPNLSIDMPEGLPEKVEKMYREALIIIHAAPNARTGAFRAAIDHATKDESVLDKKWHSKNLYERIEQIDTLPPAMREWAHFIREEGNGGLHCSDKDEKLAAEVQKFTYFFLMYVYDLPAKLKRARAKE